MLESWFYILIILFVSGAILTAGIFIVVVIYKSLSPVIKWWYEYFIPALIFIFLLALVVIPIFAGIRYLFNL